MREGREATGLGERRYRELAERLEQGNLSAVSDGARPAGGAEETALDLLLAGVSESSVDESAPTPAAPADAVRIGEVRLPGRHTLGGAGRRGVSPKRQVRLPVELDAELVACAEREHRDVSAIMREALERYLHAS